MKPLLAALVALLGLVRSPSSIPTREQIELDLAIEVELVGSTPLHAWWDFGVRAKLVNRSKTATYLVVRPGDGSESGWREPSIETRAEIERDGVWQGVRRTGLGRCGNYDPDWTDEIVELAPGATLALDPLLDPARPFADAGHVRLSVHYDYAARGVVAGERETREGEGEFGRMKGWPKFHVASAPLEFTFAPGVPTKEAIEGELALELDPGARLDAGPVALAALRPSLAIRNRSATRAHAVARPFDPQRPSADGAWIHVEVQIRGDGEEWVDAPMLAPPPPKHGVLRPLAERAVALAPLARAVVAESFAPVELWSRVPPRAGRARMRARYTYAASYTTALGVGDKPRYPECLGALADVPPFELASEWIEFELAVPKR